MDIQLMIDRVKSAIEERSVMTVILAALLAGSGSSLGIQALSDPRPDPWTGTEAREAHRLMEQSWHEDLEVMNKRLERIEIRMDLRFDRLQDMIRNHDEQ